MCPLSHSPFILQTILVGSIFNCNRIMQYFGGRGDITLICSINSHCGSLFVIRWYHLKLPLKHFHYCAMLLCDTILLFLRLTKMYLRFNFVWIAHISLFKTYTCHWCHLETLVMFSVQTIACGNHNLFIKPDYLIVIPPKCALCSLFLICLFAVTLITSSFGVSSWENKSHFYICKCDDKL